MAETTARVLRLLDLGDPVHAEHGAAGGYRLGAGGRLPPLLLDDSEAVAVSACVRLAAGGTVEGLGEAAVRTLAKLDQVLPARLRAQVEAIHASTVTLDFPTQAVDASSLLTIAQACREHVRITFTYAAARGEPPSAAPSPTDPSPPGGGGTCSPGTSTARTGGPSASTGWARSSPGGGGSHRERRATQPTTCGARSARRPTTTSRASSSRPRRAWSRSGSPRRSGR